jgi:16S rRNA (adenine1518-N6/adenine1519-N6)-dimethyltransferase
VNKRPARKQFGQHFLEPAWVEKLVRAIDVHPGDRFIEIGPGRGALTRPLAARAGRVVAYEIDTALAADLEHEAIPRVDVIRGDFLAQPLTPESVAAAFGGAPDPGALRVAGNLPYNVASPIMFRLVDAFLAGVPFADATLMLQREVADRLLAAPGTKAYGVLTVLITHCARVDLLLKLPPGAFRPAPRVLSSVVKLTFHAPEPAVRNRRAFERLVQAVFTQRRKTMANALRAVAADPVPVAPSWLDSRRRPETLTVAEFARLADDL